MLLMVILVSVTIGGLLMAMVIDQNKSTRFVSSRVRALNAAQAGVDVMIGRIRSAVTPSNGAGDSAKLPCTALSGTVNGTGTATYQVTVAYYATNPTTGGSPTNNCVQGYGPYFAGSSTQTPQYARITSAGNDAGGANAASVGRTIQSTYVFKTEQNQVKGGLLHVAGGCLAAQSAAPTASTAVTLQTCNSASQAQLWGYNTNLSISLTATLAPGSTPMCIDVGSALPTASSPLGSVTMQPCSTSPLYPQQMFALAAGPYLMATAPDGRTQNSEYNRDLDNVCLFVATGMGATLQVIDSPSGKGNCSFVSPDANTGAGPAGAATAQLVNYARFGRCLDVQGSSYPNRLIGYTCTVETPVEKTPGNERWHYGAADPAPTATAPVSGSIWSYRNTNSNPAPPFTATDGNQKYCMTSPGVAGATVTVSACSNAAIASPPTNQNWTVYRTTDAAGAALGYTASYRIVDSTGQCLASDGSDNITLQACSASTYQKWNADPNVLQSAVTGVCEYNKPTGTCPN